MTKALFLGDCLAQLRNLPDASVDSIVTDPPYGLGFMGKKWDALPPGQDVFEQCLRVLKPGGHLLSFGGSRTYHRLAVAVEDAGFEIRDQIMWLYGSGFPKSQNVGKAIDKASGAERETLSEHKTGWKGTLGGKGAYSGLNEAEDIRRTTAPATDEAKQWDGWGTALKPAFENIVVARKALPTDGEQDIIGSNLTVLEARLWLLLNVKTADAGFQSSPSEYDEALNIAQWSVDDATNTRADLCAQMDTSRFEWAASIVLSTVSSWKDTWGEAWKRGSTFITKTVTSRTIDLKTLSASASEITPDSTIRAAIRQSEQWWNALTAASVLNAALKKLSATLELSAVEDAIEKGRTPSPDAIDKACLNRQIVVARKPLDGTVAGNVVKHGTGAINVDGCRVGTTKEVPGAVKTGKPITAESWLKKHGYGSGFGPREMNQSGMNPEIGRFPANVIHDGSDEVLEAFAAFGGKGGGYGVRGSGPTHNRTSYALGGNDETVGYGDSGSAARFFYCAKASKRDRTEGGEVDNKHPTVKPVELMRYLCRLVTPPGGIVLDPFMGSGSTGKAAVQEGFIFFGIEADPESHETARQRIELAEQETDK